MKNKLIRIFLALVVALPVLTPVLAISAEDLLDRLDGIQTSIKDIKDAYKEELTTYSNVVDSLSNESKATIDDLMNGLILEEGMTERVDALKAELAASTVEGADELLTSTEGAEDAFYDLVKDNKDIVEEVKSGYSNMTTDEIKQVVEKVVEITDSLGLEIDTTKTYNDMMKILEEAHGLALDINVRLESIIPNNVSTFEDALTLDLVKELLTEVKAKDRVAVIDTLKAALNNANGGAELKAHLQEVKEIALELKDKLEYGVLDSNLMDEQVFLEIVKLYKSSLDNNSEYDYVILEKSSVNISCGSS